MSRSDPMTMKLRDVIRIGLTLNEVREAYMEGLISIAVFRAYGKVWRNILLPGSAGSLRHYEGAITETIARKVLSVCAKT